MKENLREKEEDTNQGRKKLQVKKVEMENVSLRKHDDKEILARKDERTVQKVGW